MMSEKSIKEATVVELLSEIINRNGLTEAPKKITLVTEHHECIVGIGGDDIAVILISNESNVALNEIISKEVV